MRHPMQRALTLTLLVFGVQAAPAQEPDALSDTVRQRASIADTRRAETRRLDAMATECEHKFAVTRCLDKVHEQRLVIEGRLNRQEAALNDEDRRTRAQEVLERNREKAAEHAKRLEDAAVSGPAQPRQPKLPQQPASAPAPRQPTQPETLLSPEARSANAREYERKQAQAVAKREEVAKRVKEAGVAKPSLPKPP